MFQPKFNYRNVEFGLKRLLYDELTHGMRGFISKSNDVYTRSKVGGYNVIPMVYMFFKNFDTGHIEDFQ